MAKRRMRKINRASRKNKVEDGAEMHGERRQRKGDFEDAGIANEAELSNDDGDVVGEVVADVEAGGEQEQAGVKIAAPGTPAEVQENPEGRGQKACNLKRSRGARRGPSWPIQHGGKRADDSQEKGNAARPPERNFEDAGEEAKKRDDNERGESAVD